MNQDQSFNEIEILKREIFLLQQDQQSYQQLTTQFDQLKFKFEQLCQEKQNSEERFEEEFEFL